mmetsp:Transcript_80343/g.260379  ORF Transcript_80343/g.260379 Transcript_80343/m.260379 type:complete len:489 (-) Transcript_80343:154-1620(-)
MAGNVVAPRRALVSLLLCASGLAEATQLRRRAPPVAAALADAVDSDIAKVESLAQQLAEELSHWGAVGDEESPPQVVSAENFDRGVLGNAPDAALQSVKNIAAGAANGPAEALQAAKDLAEGAVDEAGKAPDEAMESVRENWEKGQEAASDALNKTKPLLNKINVMRADMCWDRKDLWAHEKCVKFLGIMCSQGTTGHGTCDNFIKSVREHCDHPANEVEIMMCKFVEKLNLIPEAETEEKKEEAVAEGGPDEDGDKTPDADDLWPHDPKEWADVDKDGIGENSDTDVKSNTSVTSSEADGGGKDDRDGDGVKDWEDAFSEDPSEWGDFDQDGKGDNSDEDIDGDGVLNGEDSHPRDPAHGGKSDRDGDGVSDKDDAFPDDPKEHADRDGDGVGDSADEHPDDPNCSKSPCEDPNDVAHRLNKVERGLPPDGYDEHTPGLVEHDDMKTATSDWQSEWPRTGETQEEAMLRICAEDPDNTWCKKYGYHL